MGKHSTEVMFVLLVALGVLSPSATSAHAVSAVDKRVAAPVAASNPTVSGTAISPLNVRVLPAPRTAADVENEAYEHGEKRTLDRKMTEYTGDLALVTLFVLLVALAQAVLFFVQLRLMRASLADTKAAAIAATLGAKASQQSADTAKISMIASERAYVHFAGLRYISHTHLADGRIFWRLRPHWRNSGNTPTRGLRVYVRYEFRDEILPTDYPFALDVQPNEQPSTISLEPSGTIGSGTHDLWGTDLADVAKGIKHLYVWGVATYRSVFDESGEHVTKFCVKAENITGDPTAFWNPDLPFGIDFVGVSHHNCADEDCRI
ncbi:hypothetical protein PQQ88_01740 [Paraburkholderia caledonica]|uniref:hypothetical protein n=1 Tax=Paraburkholderia caledonica TaxID=134536 RepID=UPI0038B909CD